MIHIHTEEPTQRDNFNINPSAVCLLCSKMLCRITQIFIDGSSAGALLATFAFFSCFSCSILPSFLRTENAAHAQHCPSASSSGNSNISWGLGSHFLPQSLNLCRRAELCFSSACSSGMEEFDLVGLVTESKLLLWWL